MLVVLEELLSVCLITTPPIKFIWKETPNWCVVIDNTVSSIDPHYLAAPTFSYDIQKSLELHSNPNYRQVLIDHKELIALGHTINHSRVALAQNAIVTRSGVITNTKTQSTTVNGGCVSSSGPNFPRPNVRMSKVITLAALWTEGIWHFPAEALSGLAAVPKSWVANASIHIASKTPYVMQWLQLAGIRTEQVIAETVLADQLIIPEMGKCGTPTPTQVLWLVDLINNHLPSQAITEDVVLVERTRSRSMPNFEMIRDVARRFCKKRGLNLVIFSDRTTMPSLIFQLNVFRRAAVVISPHGAGLVNILACQKGTRIIEFMLPTYVNLCYTRLAYLIGLPYVALPYEADEITIQTTLNQLTT